MGKTIVPEVVTYFCDKCKKEVESDYDFDAKIKTEYAGRDYNGNKAGMLSETYDLCATCAAAHRDFFTSDNQ